MRNEIYQKQLKPLLEEVFRICAENKIYYYTNFEIGEGLSYSSVFYEGDSDDFIKVISAYSDSRGEDSPRFAKMSDALMRAYVETDNLN